MPRAKSQNKRNAILEAATHIFAERGLGAPTAVIAHAAGVAEGTVFLYFPGKDALINALYREIRLELADAMMSNFPRRKILSSRLEHVWNQYLDWGLANPKQHTLLRRAVVWEGLTPESREAGSAPFTQIASMAEEAAQDHILQNLPGEFIPSALSALAETTIDLTRTNPTQAATYRQAGFAMFWNGIARK